MRNAAAPSRPTARGVLTELPTSLERHLDNEPVRLTIQYIARRLGIDDGEQELVFRLTNGLLRETAIGRRRIRPEELEVLGLRPPPPFQGRPS